MKKNYKKIDGFKWIKYKNAERNRMSAASAASDATMKIALSCKRAIDRDKHHVNILVARWNEEAESRQKQLIERARERLNAKWTLKAFFQRNICVRKYDASKPKNIIASRILRITAQKMYLDMLEKARAATTLVKYFKQRDAEREISVFWHNLAQVEKLHRDIRVKPFWMISLYHDLTRRFNCR